MVKPKVQIGSDKATINVNILTAVRSIELADKNFEAFEVAQIEKFTEDDARLTLVELEKLHDAYVRIKVKAVKYLPINVVEEHKD